MRSTASKEIEESYQLFKSLVPIKPYPTLEGFKTVFAELAEKIPAAKTADPKDFVDTRFLEELDAPVSSVVCTNSLRVCPSPKR